MRDCQHLTLIAVYLAFVFFNLWQDKIDELDDDKKQVTRAKDQQSEEGKEQV